MQLVAIDQLNLNSDVVVFFASIDDIELTPDQIAQLPAAFYAHTTVSAGVLLGLWEKIGKAEIYVDLSKLVFKYERDQAYIDTYLYAINEAPTAEIAQELRNKLPFDKPFWDIWTVGDKAWRRLEYTEGSRVQAQSGVVYAPQHLIKRIEGGRQP